MPFSPRLPTFNTECAWFKWDPDAELYIEQESITGQVYTPQRGQDDDNAGLLYFVYPKGADVLHDPYDYSDAAGPSDVLIIEYPKDSASYRAFKVREVSPRWLGFPNEHLMVSLQRLTQEEMLEIISSDPEELVGVWTSAATTSFSGDIDWDTIDPFESIWLSGPVHAVSFLLELTQNFYIALDPSAVILGLELSFTRVDSTAPTPSILRDAKISLFNNDTNEDIDVGTLADYPSGGADGDVVLGGPTDMLGTSFTAPQLIAGDCVLRYKVELNPPPATPAAAHFKDASLKVYYYLP